MQKPLTFRPKQYNIKNKKQYSAAESCNKSTLLPAAQGNAPK
jgi:hypothetical protein